MKLEQLETVIEDLGMFTCKVTDSVPPMFRIRGATVDRERSVQYLVAARPATTLVLPMSPETAIQLAVEILKAATEAKIELPKEVSYRSPTA
jgi:hypothetical protein